VGANGSGKSTIVKSLAGYHDSVDSGHVVVRGVTYELPLRGVTAKKADIRFVHQDLGLVDQMSITDNVCLYAGYAKTKSIKIRRAPSEQLTQKLLEGLGIAVPPSTTVGSLGPTEKVMVAVARATVSHGHRGVLILDEPTAAVPLSDAERILKVVRDLRDSGWAVLYISHHLDEVLDLADRITVLRDGEIVASDRAADVDVSSLTRAIIGEGGEAIALVNDREADPLLVTPSGARTNGSLELVNAWGRRLQDVNLRFDPGTVVGITGPTGSGKSELGRILSGAEPLKQGSIILDDQAIALKNPRDALLHGIGYVPQDRIKMGILAKASVRENLSGLQLRRFVGRFLNIRRKLEQASAAESIREFGIVLANQERPIATLSGGNQQKAVLARAAKTSTRVLILDDPTSGVDVGARSQIQGIVKDLAKTDIIVIILSSDLDELIALCDRIVVLRRGVVSSTLRTPVSREHLAQAIFGG
jgi:ribose transport system ATP-binding protein